MKRNFSFRFIMLALVAVLFAVTSCKDYDDDIIKIEKAVEAYKGDLEKKLSDNKSQFDERIAAVNKAIDAAKADIKALDGEVKTLKADLAALEAKSATKAELDAVKTSLAAAEARLDKAIKDLADSTVKLAAFEAYKKQVAEEMDAIRAKLDLAATKAEVEAIRQALDSKINAVKDELGARIATIEALLDISEGKSKVLDKINADLKSHGDQLAEHAKKLEEHFKLITENKEALEELKSDLKVKYEKLKDDLDQLTTRVAANELAIKANEDAIEDNKAAIQKNKEDIAEHAKKLENHAKTLKKQAEDIKANADAIAKANERIAANEKAIAENKEAIAANLEKIIANEKAIAANAENIEKVKKSVEDLRKDFEEFKLKVANDLKALKEELLKKIAEEVEKLEKKIKLNLDNIISLSKQLKGLTFIPTRGLPSEKTMKLYYFAGDYTADHVLMYRVTPSNARLGEDFTIESLNFQITTRSADDGVEDHSSKVDIHINGEVTQKGDIIYIPVHVKGAEACKVFGDITWWGNEFFHGENVLSGYYGDPDPAPSAYVPGQGDYVSFPPHVVITDDDSDKKVNYYAKGGHRGLSIVVTATTNNIKDEAEAPVGWVRVKSTEHVHAELIPTQIKLAEVVGKNGLMNFGPASAPSLKSRLLKFTRQDAIDWANENEGALPNDNKNWNVLMWSGTPIAGQDPMPGEIDLYDYVTSFYYPQDGGDYKNEKVIETDPFRHFYNEFGAFGEPYTDKPVYAKPVYEFEQVAYIDKGHNIITIGEDIEPTHTYTVIEGSMLKVRPKQISAANNKKVIIKVTQVNSTCTERQPVGYLVVKIVESTAAWADVNWTFDFTQDKTAEPEERASYKNIPYYHKLYRTADPANTGEEISDFKTANGNEVDARWMNALNHGKNWGTKPSLKNPGDIDGILNLLPTANSAEEFDLAYVLHKDSEVKEQNFVPADYNHVFNGHKVYPGIEDPATLKAAIKEAFEHVLIRFEHGANSYVVYVDDKAPAGDYSITYKVQYKKGAVQAGADLYVTFKFRVAHRGVEATKKDNVYNWRSEDGMDIIRAQYTREKNTLGYKFVSDGHTGYVANLTEAFEHDPGTKAITLKTLAPAADSNTVKPSADNVPQYRPRFEFIYDKAIEDAGFVFARDGDNYLTIIHLKDKPDNVAAKIEKNADNFERLRILNSSAGDRFYNYLMSRYNVHKMGLLHNMITRIAEEDATLESEDDMEKILKVRMVTDLNFESPDAAPQPQRFPNGNYYYIKDFGVKFERALRFKFTTVELTDKQTLQTAEFNFAKRDRAAKIYRGLFDHGYAEDASKGIGYLVAPGIADAALNEDLPTSATPTELADWYGLTTKVVLPLRNATSVDYKFVEVSYDGTTWSGIPLDLQFGSSPRYFDITTDDNKEKWTVKWQGNTTGVGEAKPIYFRVPIINKTAIERGLMVGNPDELTITDAKDGMWASFRVVPSRPDRTGYAKVKGYAVFKINPRF